MGTLQEYPLNLTSKPLCLHSRVGPWQDPPDSDSDFTKATLQKQENDNEEVNMEGAQADAVFLVCVFVYIVVDAMNIFLSV